ncbi:MAG: vitamin K epoxide reductase family protein [Bifidobacteriaceae bacterium]|nr:vitamin K epoxide reductase family protein [Bifidobacteriaceae bacterium]
MNVEQRPLTGFRHNALWVYSIALLASLGALFVSFALSVETLELAKHPNQALACDVNGVISCTTVAQSWQSTLLQIAGVGVPNAFIGIAAESVFVTVAVLGLTKIRFPRWFSIATWCGSFFAFAGTIWLISQSMFVINALCPWCLGLFFCTTLQFFAFSHATVVIQKIGHTKLLNTIYRFHYDIMLEILWILLVIACIVIKYSAVLFS